MFGSSPFYWQMEKAYADNKGPRVITEEMEGGFVNGKAL